MVTIFVFLLLLPFIVAILGVGGTVGLVVLGVLALPFVWLWSAFQTNKS